MLAINIATKKFYSPFKNIPGPKVIGLGIFLF
jgi:hypothetical protein